MIFPVRISTKNRTDVSIQMGPWPLNGALYAFVLDETPAQIGVSKSTDGGLTWTFQDSANAPPVLGNPRYSVVQFGDTIRIVYGDNSTVIPGPNTGILHLIDFDTLTDTFGAVSDSTIAWGAGGIADPAPSIVAQQKANGDTFIVFVNFASISTSQLRYVVYSAGVWGSPVDITAIAANTLVQPTTALIDPLSALHVPYVRDISAVRTLQYANISQIGVITAGQQILATFEGYTGNLSIIGLNLVLPYATPSVPASRIDTLTVQVGTPYTSATPVWAPSSPDTNTYSANFSYRDVPVVLAVGTTLYCTWSVYDSFDPSANDQVWYSTSVDGITWTAPALLYDAALHPPGWTGLGPIEQMSLNDIGSGVVMFTGLINTAGTATLGEIEISELLVSCNNPPAGAVGTPYTHTFTASGGTAPYTFSITSGTLPDGLTLDSATGIVSGTPTVAALFAFTVTVTDSSGTTTSSSAVAIDALSVAAQNQTWVQAHKGPWYFGGNRFVLARDGRTLQFYGSSDNGQTWAEFGSPQNIAVDGAFKNVDACPDLDGSLVWVTWIDAATLASHGELIVQSFDLSNGTWSSVSTGGPQAYFSFGADDDTAGSAMLARIGAGDFGLIYHPAFETIAGSTHWTASTYVGGSAFRLSQAALAGDALISVFLSESTFSAPSNGNYLEIEAETVLITGVTPITGGYTLNVTRAQFGTTATGHALYTLCTEAASGAVLQLAVSAGATTWRIGDGPYVPVIGQTLTCEAETVTITSVSALGGGLYDIGVTRGTFLTTAASHAAGRVVAQVTTTASDRWDRVAYIRYTAGVWGTPVAIGGQTSELQDYTPHGIVKGDGVDVAFMVSVVKAFPYPGATYTLNLYACTIDHGTGIATAPVLITDELAWGPLIEEAASEPSVRPLGGTVEVSVGFSRVFPGYPQSDNANLQPMEARATALSPLVFTTTPITETESLGVGGNPVRSVSVIGNASARWTVWAGQNPNPPYVLYYSRWDDTGGIWGTPVALYTEAGILQTPTCMLLSTIALGMVFSQYPDAGTNQLMYFELGFGATASVDCSINITDVQPSITCGNPPDGTVGLAYAHTFPVSGGVPPYTFAITFGALPNGLSLNASTGEVTGTPTLAGTFPFAVQVTDDDGNTDTVECSITIGSDLSIECGDPPQGTVGTAYSHTFPITGGTPPYTTILTAGSVPGLTLDPATATLSGTPTLAGTYSLTVQVTDNDGNTANVECSIRINDVLEITCGNPPAGVVGEPYSHEFPITGGVEPYTTVLTSGSVPGLTLDPSTAVLSGTPTTAGTYPLTVQVTDANDDTANVECSIPISTTGNTDGYGDGGGGGNGPSCRKFMPTLFQATCLNPHRLLRQYRDNWGEYNALAVEKLDRICNLGCYVPRFYHAPSNPDELFAAGAYLSYNLRIPPGSWICNFDSMTREGLNLQITDVALNKRWFSSPIPCELLQPSSQSGGPRCNYFPAPYPVTDPGTFIVELWNRTNAQLRCQLTLAVAVPKDACA